MKKIGFIGLGHMGMPMAQQLLKNNYIVYGYDTNQDNTLTFQQQGGHVFKNLNEIASICEVIITMLPNIQALLDFYHPQHAFIKCLKPNTLIIDCSTVGPIGSIQWHAIAKNYNLISVDAPVSGGVVAASHGNLSFMLGGEETAVDAAREILMTLGSKFIFTGKAGSGQAAKVCNNLILANNMIAVCEAFTLAKKLNLDPEKFLEVVQSSSGNSWVTEKYLPLPHLMDNVPANNNYQAGFSGQMMLKDLNLALEASLQKNLKLSLTKESQDLFASMVQAEKGDKDFSYIYEFIQEKQNN